MKIAIIEDQKEDREQLLSLLSEYMSHYNTLYTCDCFESGEKFLETVDTDEYDVCFMDIYMGGMTGIETTERLLEIDPACIVMFLTSSDQHWRDGFRLQAWRYLKKPLDMAELQEAMPVCMERIRCAQRRLSVNVGRQELQLPFSKIYYIATAWRSVEIHGKTETITASMKVTFEALATQLLTDYRFLSLGRGLVVHMGYVKSVENGQVLMQNGDSLPISRGKINEVSEAILCFQFENR